MRENKEEEKGHVLSFFFSGPIDDRKRRDLIFRGEIIIFKQLPKMKELCDFADSLISEAFGDIEPATAYEYMDRHRYLRAVDPLQRCFTNHPMAKYLFHGALAEAGVELDKTYRDWFPLRIQPPKGAHPANSTIGYAVMD